jgi:hypothetical protein
LGLQIVEVSLIGDWGVVNDCGLWRRLNPQSTIRQSTTIANQQSQSTLPINTPQSVDPHSALRNPHST